MNFSRVKAVYFFVKDIKMSSSWYSKVLGLPLSINDEDFAQILIGDTELCFHLADQKSPVDRGGSVSYWHTESLKGTIAHFESAGASLYRGPIEIPENDEGICQLKDPFGNVIGFQGYFRKS